MNVHVILNWLLDGARAAGFQLLAVCGGLLALSALLHCAGSGIRGACGGTFGKWYYRFVAPGVICHETGHALGCLLTRTRIVSFKPFQMRGNTLGCVVHELHNGFFGPFAETIIATGPIWFGCTVIILLSRFVAGADFLPPPVFQADAGFAENATAVFRAAADMFTGTFAFWRWKSPWFALYLYLFLCIASEMTLSPSDLKCAWKGILCAILVLYGLNLLPWTSHWIALGVSAIQPELSILHVLLTFALMADIAFILTIAAPVLIIGRMSAR